jgi:hypothetical protein
LRAFRRAPLRRAAKQHANPLRFAQSALFFSRQE